nr:ThuA domain-containing protein [Candidatus Sigynarchaeota archaeon]
MGKKAEKKVEPKTEKQPEKKPAKKPRACITYGGYEGHTPAASSMLVQDLLEEAGYEVDMKQTLAIYEDAAYLESLDLLVQCWTMSELKGEQVKGLTNAIMDGLGLVGFHGGLNDSFRQATDYEFLIGSNFVSHPGGAVDYDVNIAPGKKDDPIVKGVKDFHLKSEQYYINVDPAILSGVNGEILCTSTFHNSIMFWIDGVVMPVVYKRRWGDGKIFYASFGHTYNDFEVPEAKEILRRGLLWATRERAP